MAVSHVMNVISNAGVVAAGTGSGAGGGGGASLDTQTVTVGSDSYFQAGGSIGGVYIPAQYYYYSGLMTNFPPSNQSISGGSISDGTSNIYGGAAIEDVYHLFNDGFDYEMIYLVIAGNTRANSGWTTMTIGSTAFARTDAAFQQGNAQNAPNSTIWYWVGGTNNSTGSALYNPFSSSGTTTTVTFT